MSEYRGRRRKPDDEHTPSGYEPTQSGYEDHPPGGYDYQSHPPEPPPGPSRPPPPPGPPPQSPPPGPPGPPPADPWQDDQDDEPLSWIDRGPLAYEEPDEFGGEYEQPPRRYSSSERRYRRGDRRGAPPPREHGPPHPEHGVGPPGPAGDEPTRGFTPPPDRPARRGGPPDGPREGPPPRVPPSGRRPPPTDADATTVIPSLRHAPQAPPTPIPKLRFNPADTTMLMSAVPYVAPSATPAYTGTIYVSYAAGQAQLEEEAAAAPEAERETAAASVARSGAIMAAGSIVSRLTGFLRVAAIGAAIGAGVVGDTYSTANTVPGMVYELLLGGILTSVLVPLLVRARENDPDRGQAFAQRLLTLAVLALGAATVLAVLSAPLLTAVMAGDNHGPAARDLMTSLAYLLLPEVFFFGLAGVLQALLNSRGHFAAPMWTPILNNLVVISAAVAFMVVSRMETPKPGTITALQIGVLGIGTTLGILVQAVGLIPALRRVGFRWRWRFDFRELHLAEIGRLAGWMACYVAVSQIGVVVIIKLAYAAGSAEAADGAAVAGAWIYQNAFLLFMMAHGIVVVSVITALMPRMSVAAANHEYGEVARHLSLGTRLTAVVLIPVTALYLLLSGSITVVLFQWGNYTAEQAQAAAPVVAVAGLGLVPFAISQLQTFAFYALTETRTAALVNIPVVGIKVLVDIGLYYTLPAKHVAIGLMVGNLISYTLGAVISARLLRSRLGPMGQGAVFRTLARLALAGLLAALATMSVLYLVNLVLGSGKLAELVRVLVGSVVLLVVYLALAWVMRVREISQVFEMVDRKLGGRLSRKPDDGDDDGDDEDDDGPPAPAPTPRPGGGTVYGGQPAAPPRGHPYRRQRRYPDEPAPPGPRYPDEPAPPARRYPDEPLAPPPGRRYPDGPGHYGQPEYPDDPYGRGPRSRRRRPEPPTDPW